MSSRPLGSTIFEDGKLKPGLYKIQNLVSKTYIDIQEHTMGVCCRPASALERDDGIWEILPFGAGHTIRRVHPEYAGKPDCFCTVKAGLTNGSPICISPFPVAWNIKVAEDEIYKGFEYVRIFWDQKKNTSWDLAGDGSKNDETRVQLMDDERILPCRVWKFTLVRYFESGMTPRLRATTSTPPRSNNLPPYEQETCCSCAHQDTENRHDDEDFGTTVIEVTTVTKTTRKKYRVTEE